MALVDYSEDEGPLEPRRNPELFGHEKTEQVLLDAVDSGRLAHAWLICGPKGIGKATLAHRFARYLLINGIGQEEGGLFGEVPAPTTTLYVSPDNPVFHRTAASGHADLLTIERGLNDKGKLRTEISVNDVREIGPFLSLTAAEGGWRVVIIDSADEMNRNAANAVLKVLEEPPSKAILLLVCHNPGSLLPTIRSRCRRLVLEIPPTDTAIKLLRQYHPDFSAENARLIIQLCDGSIGQALSMAEEGGLDLYLEMTRLLKTVPNLDVSALHRFADKIGKAGADDAFRTSMELFKGWLHRLIMAVADDSAQQTDGFSDDDIALIHKLSNTGRLDQWLEVWEKVQHLLSRTDSVNLERKQVVLNIFLSLNETARS